MANVQKGPPIFHHRGAPGLWSWDDFRAVGLPEDCTFLRPEEELYAIDPGHVEAFRAKLYSEWDNAALRALPNAGSRVFQIDVGDEFRPREETTTLGKKPDSHRRCYLFVDKLSKSVLEDLGVRYKVDVDYFRACFDASVSQGTPSTGNDSHIWITLPFLRPRVTESTPSPPSTWTPSEHLALDLLGLCMIRRHEGYMRDGGTVVVYYPQINNDVPTPLLEHYHWTVRMGREAYWSRLSDKNDAAFLILPVLWWVVYAWADALQALYLHLDRLEIKVLQSPSVQLTQEFHTIRICLLNYHALLEDFHKTIAFIRSSTKIEVAPIFPTPRDLDQPRQFELECEKMDVEITRLQNGVQARNERIKDIMNMVFSHVTIQDSTAMKQISWITMFFLPATFVAGVFGMNVSGIGPQVTTLLNYVETAIPFTVVTIWILVALLPESQAGKPLWERFSWPFLLFAQAIWNLIRALGAIVSGHNRRRENGEALPLPVLARTNT